MNISELSDALAHVPPFTQVVVLIVSAFGLAGYALYIVDRGRR